MVKNAKNLVFSLVFRKVKVTKVKAKVVGQGQRSQGSMSKVVGQGHMAKVKVVGGVFYPVDSREVRELDVIN